MWRADSLEKTLMLGKIQGRRRRGWQRMSWLDGITNSMDMVWVDSGSWWWTGRPGVLWFMGSQRVGHDCSTELNWTSHSFCLRAVFKTRQGPSLFTPIPNMTHVSISALKVSEKKTHPTYPDEESVDGEDDLWVQVPGCQKVESYSLGHIAFQAF